MHVSREKVLDICARSDYMFICLMLVHVSLMYEFTTGARLVNLSGYVTYSDFSANSF